MNKKLILLSLIIVFITCFTPSSFALTTLYEKCTEEKISSGVNLKNYNRLSEKGWLNINVLEVDLDDRYTSVGLLTPEKGLNTLQNLLDMAKNNESIAAINGDFFSGKSTNAYTVGLAINEGEVLTSTYLENEKENEFASFILDEDNNAFLDYFTNTITLTKSKNKDIIFTIKDINKLSTNYDSTPVIYTSDWGEKSIGSFSYLPVTEMLVKDNKVKKIQSGEEGIKIPKDGFVISATGSSAEFLENNFKVGDKVILDISLSPDIEDIQMAVSGGTILIKDGEIANFASNITGSHPRSAIGISKDEDTLYLVTVDGRQNNSIGMTQTELAEFLIEKDIYNAINLDGGGSTTMVAQKLGDTNLSVINSPSSGALRNITNGIGIFNASKKGSLANLLIEVTEENVFVNCEKELIVKGYDKYYNPIEIDIDDVEFKTSGVSGEIKDGILIAGNEAGTITVTAKKGKAKTSINIDILSAPNELKIEPKKSYINKNEKVNFSITAKNKNGYYASIKNSELDFKIISGDGILEDGTYIPKKDGIHLIEVSAGTAKSYALVEVASTKETKIDYISNDNYKLINYPSDVTSEITKINNDFINLQYDFSKTSETRASYIRFNEPIALSENDLNISFDVISKETISDYIKLKIIDNEGTTKLIMAQRGFDESKDVQTINVSLESIKLPAKLTDIYVGQDTKDILSKGEIQISNIIITSKNKKSYNDIIIPKDIKGLDVANKAPVSGEKVTKIAICDSITKPITLLDKLKNTKLENSLNENADLILFTSQVNELSNTNITKPIIKTNSYEKTSYENLELITIDVSNGGLRATDYTQWVNLQNDITLSENKNILILMKGNLDNFSDENEKKLFIDVMCELKRNNDKNIWIIAEGDYTDYSMERGIRYLSVNNEILNPSEPIEIIKNTSYILISIVDNNLTYEIKNIF